MKIVKVKWVDSCSPEGIWHDKASIPNKPLVIRSCGYLVSRNKHQTVLVIGYHGKHQIAHVLRIPTCAIKKFTIL